MESADWSKIHYFKPSENWGDLNLLSFALVSELDIFRYLVQTPIQISCGTQGIHTEHSQHYGGLAVDIIFPEKELYDIPDLLLCALKFKFNGVGVYPNWKYKDKVIGGMHLDIREAPYKNLWIGLETGKYQHLDFDKISTYFVR